VNKTQLIDALSTRYEGNRKQAQHALESVLDVITREVSKGEKVAITGFGSFEKRIREARWVRNPATGERIKAKKTAIPKFNAGAELKAVVSGKKKLPKLPKATDVAKAATARKTTGSAAKATPAKTSAAKTTTATTTAKKATAKSTATKSATSKALTAKKAPAKATTAKSATAKTTTAKKSPAKSTTAKKSPAKSTTANSTTSNSTTAKKTTTRKAAAKKA
jgi:DNA-binding protein HU-beta